MDESSQRPAELKHENSEPADISQDVDVGDAPAAPAAETTEVQETQGMHQLLADVSWCTHYLHQ
jgi:hypothetical protein